MESTEQIDDCSDEKATVAEPEETLSKNARKKLLKQQKYEAKKAEKKALMKTQKKMEVERKRKEWEENLASLETEEERAKLVESRKELRKERMEKRSEEKSKKTERLKKAKENGQNIVVDLDFAHLMTPAEHNSLVQQIMYCYAVNGRCACPAHVWLTGCHGEMSSLLQRLPGYEKWIIEKEDRPYFEAFSDRKEDLVYLTADSDNVIEELDISKIYIIGGLVDRNRWKGITMKKAVDQGIQTAKLPIGAFLKMSSSQVLTVNQVMEILLKYLETRDWKNAFFQVIPQRKRFGSEENNQETTEEVPKGESNEQDTKRQCM